MKFSFELYDKNADVSITIKNLSLSMLNEFSTKESIEEIISQKFYMYGVYDKMNICGNEFMVLKISKKCVVLLNVAEC